MHMYFALSPCFVALQFCNLLKLHSKDLSAALISLRTAEVVFVWLARSRSVVDAGGLSRYASRQYDGYEACDVLSNHIQA
ncbi:hypothetical protein F4774DRAFT_378039 [Daldinia eschscholtzii]|nr:hypothetical protein F4774DRAFT_378039 [Daldinia eschscholtzii]